MRHRKRGRKLGRSASHRKALLRNLASSLIAHERIVTTQAKAKEVRPFVEKLVTIAKRGLAEKEENRAAYLHAYRLVLARLQNKPAVQKLFGEGPWREHEGVAARYADRPGGYTRILRLSGSRMGTLVGSTSEQRVLEYTMPGAGPDPVERKLKLVGSRLGDNSSRVVFEFVEAVSEKEAEEAPKPTVTPPAEPEATEEAKATEETPPAGDEAEPETEETPEPEAEPTEDDGEAKKDDSAQ